MTETIVLLCPRCRGRYYWPPEWQDSAPTVCHGFTPHTHPPEPMVRIVSLGPTLDGGGEC